jgi:S1/P1 Nuclease
MDDARIWLTRLVAAALVALTTCAWGWGNEGHRTVGAIADSLLAGTPAEQKVHAILLPGETLSKASIWADCAKGYCGGLTPEMQDFVDANPRHHSYHFTDLPFDAPRYVPRAIGTDPDDIVQILGQATAVLLQRGDATSNPHNFTSRQALLLIVHLVGDVHQPLHVGTAYINQNDEFAVPQSLSDLKSGTIQETHGDNYLLIGTRLLHSYWDGDLVKRGMRRAQVTTPDEYAAFLLQKYPDALAPQGDVMTWPTQWADESLQLSKEAHRELVVGDREETQDRSASPHFQWPVTIPRDYAKRSTDQAERQLVNAGKRLANLLKAIWP